MKNGPDINCQSKLRQKKTKCPGDFLHLQCILDKNPDINWVDINYEWTFFRLENVQGGWEVKNSEKSRCPRTLMLNDPTIRAAKWQYARNSTVLGGTWGF